MDLEKTRKLLKLEQHEMARLMGISRLHNYQRLEAGRRPLTIQQEQIVETIKFVSAAGLLEQLLARRTTNNISTLIDRALEQATR